MTMKSSKICTAMLGTSMLMALSAHASLTPSFQFNGNGNWSLDAVGGLGTPVGTVEAVVPTGSTIVKAYLYSSFTPAVSPSNLPDVTLDGVTYSGADWTPLGVNSAAGLQAFRTDVTAQMQSAIGGGSASPFSFTVTENSLNPVTDGEVLAIIYSNPAEATRSIAFLDGFSASGGDTATINFGSPLAGVGDPGFEALLSLGIGYGFQGGAQYSLIDGNGRRLTSSAGGQDDGVGSNGGLITVGGIGDSSDNPDPNAPPSDPRTDDELYDLGKGNIVDPTPFLANGINSYTFTTQNPSSDDNIFFLGVNITAEGAVVVTPNDTPDAGATVALLGLGFAGLAALRRSRKS